MCGPLFRSLARGLVALFLGKLFLCVTAGDGGGVLEEEKADSWRRRLVRWRWRYVLGAWAPMFDSLVRGFAL